MTNSNPATKTTKTTNIGARVTCRACGLTNGDHRYLCANDPHAKAFALDRKYLRADLGL